MITFRKQIARQQPQTAADAMNAEQVIWALCIKHVWKIVPKLRTGDGRYMQTTHVHEQQPQRLLSWTKFVLHLRFIIFYSTRACEVYLAAFARFAERNPQIKFCCTRKRRNGFMSYELNIAQCLSLHWMKIKAYASIHYAIPGHSYFYCLSYCLHLLCITHKICIWRRQQHPSPTPKEQNPEKRIFGALPRNRKHREVAHEPNSALNESASFLSRHKLY